MNDNQKELKAKHAFDVYEEYTKTGDVEQAQVYLKEDADAVIAGLKAQVNGFHNRANLWLYNAQNEHNAAVAVRMENAKIKAKIAEKDKEIAELKERYKDMDVTHTVHIAKMNDKIEELEYNVDFWKKKLDKVIAERDDNQVCIDALKTKFKNDQAYIAELKEKLKQEQSLRSHWNEDDYAMVNESERLFNENAELKQKLQNQCASCPVKMQEDDVVAEKDNEIRRLKRSLWLARSYRGRDNSILLPSKFMRNVWDKIERKCLKKAEQYK